MMNRLGNVHNIHQNTKKHKRVLAVCSAGLLRSPTIAWILSNEPFNFNTRAVGVDKEFALTPIDAAFVEWADEIVCAGKEHVETVKYLLDKSDNRDKVVHCLDLPDKYKFRDPELVALATEKLKKLFNKV